MCGVPNPWKAGTAHTPPEIGHLHCERAALLQRLQNSEAVA